MTHFDGDGCGELIISEREAKEIAHQLSTAGGGHRKIAMRKQQQLDVEEEDMEATPIAYLRTTYSHLHQENRQVGVQFGLNDDVDETRGSTKRVKRKLNTIGMDVVENTSSSSSSSSENSSYDSNNEICQLTRDLSSVRFDADRLKPIITFTPVHSSERDEDVDDDSRASPFYDRQSSGSSSPLLEVPTCPFRDMSAEMMRPPLN